MSPIIELTHFQRGRVEVQAEIVDGRREWTCPNRPLMRPWIDCFFTETTDEIEARLLAAHNTQFPSTKEGFGSGDRLLFGLTGAG
jgi:hypothetical protein